MLYSAVYQSPVGRLTLVAQDEALIGLWLEGQKYFGAGLPHEPVPKADEPVLAAAAGWLDRYFAGEKPSPRELPLHPEGSSFRRELWRALSEIPYGEVVTYGALAKRLAVRMHRPSMSGQAVGGSIGHNPILIILPCHRVIAADGRLTGYAGGLDVKRKLLELEGVDVSGLPRQLRQIKAAQRPSHKPSFFYF